MHRSRTTSHSSPRLVQIERELAVVEAEDTHTAPLQLLEKQLFLDSHSRHQDANGQLVVHGNRLRLRETAKPFVQRTEGLSPWYHLCSPRLICRGLCGRSRLPTPCNGSTRLVLLGRHRPFFQLLGGLLEPGHHRGTCTVLPLALAAPFSTCPRQRIVSTVKSSLRSVKGNSAAPRSPLPLPAASS